MKAFVFAAAGALALAIAAPASAATGYVGAAYQRAEIDTGAPGDDEVDGFGVEGAVAFNAAASLGFDVDAAYSDSDDSDSTTGATAHLYAKGAGYKFGGFAGIADAGDTVWSVGVEGQHNFGQFVLAGALGYANADDANVDAYGVDVQGSIFASDNLRFDAKVGWANLDAGAGGDDDAVTAGVGGEWQPTGMPISFRASYAHTEFDTANVDANAFTLGIRYNWGGSLRERNDNGPSFAGLSSLTSALGF